MLIFRVTSLAPDNRCDNRNQPLCLRTIFPGSSCHPHHDHIASVLVSPPSSKMPRYPPPASHRSFIQKKLIVAINTPTFASLLPDLADPTWDILLQGQAESRCLSVMGCSLLYSILAMELRNRFPKATAHFYTVCF